MESTAIPQIRQIVDRLERLDLVKSNLSDDIKSVYEEAKGHGFDPKIIRQVLKMRKLKEEDREEILDLLDLYLKALG